MRPREGRFIVNVGNPTLRQLFSLRWIHEYHYWSSNLDLVNSY